MGGVMPPFTGKVNMTIVTSNDIGGAWQSGKEEVNDNSRRQQNVKDRGKVKVTKKRKK
tara:strand:+ start:640 stop:813 length:174 start_codon:yes stop_codon:yes gene_type:complete